MLTSMRCAKPDAAEKYLAVDDDLPEVFWDGGKAPEQRGGGNDDLRLEVAVRVHYVPQEHKRPAGPRSSTAASFAEETREVSNRKKYIRGAKKQMMWNLLRELSSHTQRMNSWERGFITQLLGKFEAWGESTRWITEKQFYATLALAKRHLPIPAAGSRTKDGEPPTYPACLRKSLEVLASCDR